jgi:hypothetical protein
VRRWVPVSVGALAIGPRGWLGWLGWLDWLGWLGLAAIAAGYGAVHNPIIVAEARLQSLITSEARATVTSVAGLSTEVVVLAVYASFAIGTGWLPVATVVALLGLPMLGVAAATELRLDRATSVPATPADQRDRARPGRLRRVQGREWVS